MIQPHHNSAFVSACFFAFFNSAQKTACGREPGFGQKERLPFPEALKRLN
jgi:hypothetical protein